MKERPILMSGPMVRAILDGRKTQTRRVVKPQPQKWIDKYEPSMCPLSWIPSGVFLSDPSGILGKGKLSVRQNILPVKCPYGTVGDRLWARESWQSNYNPQGEKAYYMADDDGTVKKSWRPSIHMPRWASRLTLEITGVRVERLQSITHHDAMAEGVEYDASKENGAPLSRFKKLWHEINGSESWSSNPWVWVVSFRRIDGEK